MVTRRERAKLNSVFLSLPLLEWRHKLKSMKTKEEAAKGVADCLADCARVIANELGDSPLAQMALVRIKSPAKVDPKVKRDPGNVRAMMEEAFIDGGLDTGDEELEEWLARVIQEASV